jgi:hypothetical protein
MANGSFLPDQPALRADPVGDDAGENHDHSEHDDEVGEVLPERERADQLVVHRVEDGVHREVDDEAGRDDEGAGPGETGHRLCPTAGLDRPVRGTWVGAGDGHRRPPAA